MVTLLTYVPGAQRSNVGFPLLVLMRQKPAVVEWSKKEIMRLCGYSDRLQSSRRIILEDNQGGQLVLQYVVAR